MRVDWLPFSASALVAGATALAFGALLMPPGNNSLEAMRVAVGTDARWLAVAGLFFISSIAITVGLPAFLTLMNARTARLGLVAAGIFAVGCLGTAGYAMLLAFFRALVKADLLRDENLDQVIDDPGLTAFVIGWVGAFYLGELLIAVALLRAGTLQRWVPLLLLAHVATYPLAQALPDALRTMPVLLVTVGLAGVGIAANSRHLVTATV